ncbi:hypothetical protein RRG08_066693, partial [Elysia crispata]
MSTAEASTGQQECQELGLGGDAVIACGVLYHMMILFSLRRPGLTKVCVCFIPWL